MIHPGLCSLTLPTLQPAEIAELCKRSGLTHIEWWGKAHVPMGDVATATAVGRITRQAGLRISTYGSYYRAGGSEAEGLPFGDVLQTAIALGAPAIRVWAGTCGSATCSRQQRDAVIADTFRIAELCAKHDIGIVFEYHGNTLTDSNASAVAFAGAVRHAAVSFGWQSRGCAGLSENVEGLRGMLPRLATLHVHNCSRGSDGKFVRRPLAEGVDDWRRYLQEAATTGRNHVALLEFVLDDTVEQFSEDAHTLRGLVSGGRHGHGS